MNRIAKFGSAKDAVGVFLLLITGLLYAVGVTQAANDVCGHCPEAAVEAAVDVIGLSGTEVQT